VFGDLTDMCNCKEMPFRRLLPKKLSDHKRAETPQQLPSTCSRDGDIDPVYRFIVCDFLRNLNMAEGSRFLGWNLCFGALLTIALLNLMVKCRLDQINLIAFCLGTNDVKFMTI